MKRRLCLLVAALGISSAAMAEPISILFIGNSYTFGRLDPVMSYNTANVHDLTAGFNAISSTGANPWEPHPWGGVPGIFKKFTDQSGLDYDVSISARNAASAARPVPQHRQRGLGPARQRGAEDLGHGRAAGAERRRAAAAAAAATPTSATFNAYADQFERFIHNGAAQSYTETQLFGSLAACQATGSSATTCNTVAQHPGRTRTRARRPRST